MVTWDNWHAALNLEATIAVAKVLLDKWGLPFFLWRTMVYRPKFTDAWEMMANVIKIMEQEKSTNMKMQLR